ncbi:MAG: cupin domain-containing protein, partial [Myxococcota bacterium]
FSKRALVHGGRIDWVASPMPGVDRRMLDRIGGEVARATTIVRYAPGSHFSPHVHTGGEEFLVLEGVFQDEHGDFPAGSYVRNPPETRHTPASEPGCVILVKLWQFDLQDRTEVRIRTGTRERAFESASGRPGVDLLPLHADMREVVRLETWSPNAEIELRAEGGIELFVLDGSFTEGGEGFERWSWLRLPEGAPLNARAGADGAQVWLKSGHLPYATAPARG